MAQVSFPGVVGFESDKPALAASYANRFSQAGSPRCQSEEKARIGAWKSTRPDSPNGRRTHHGLAAVGAR